MAGIKGLEVESVAYKETFETEGVPGEVCGAIDREEFELILGDIRHAVSLVPEEVRSGTRLQIFGHHPDEKSQDYQGGAYGRVRVSSKGDDTLLVQIFPNALKRSDILQYTVGHEFGEVMWERLSDQEKKRIGGGFNKEKWADQQARSWGFPLPR